jgi:hypothetical protein
MVTKEREVITMKTTLKEFLEAKLTEMGFFNIKWERIVPTHYTEDDIVYVSCTNPDDNGARVTMSLAELAGNLLWQESGI